MNRKDCDKLKTIISGLQVYQKLNNSVYLGRTIERLQKMIPEEMPVSGYYKTRVYQGMKCHSNLSLFFKGKLKRWDFKVARIVSEMYKDVESTINGRTYKDKQITIAGKTFTVIDTDKRFRKSIKIKDVSDHVGGQIDQVLESEGKIYLLDYKFTGCNDIQPLIDNVREQLAYNAWGAGYGVGGAYIIASFETNEILTSGFFEFESRECDRAVLKVFKSQPGYEDISFEDIKVTE